MGFLDKIELNSSRKNSNFSSSKRSSSPSTSDRRGYRPPSPKRLPSGRPTSHSPPRMNERKYSTEIGRKRRSLSPQRNLSSRSGILLVAPDNLPGGYWLDVKLHPNQPPFSVQIPPGGVRKGQEFSAQCTPKPIDISDIDDSRDIGCGSFSSGSSSSEDYQNRWDTKNNISREKDGHECVKKNGDVDESIPPPSGKWRVGLCNSFFYNCHQGDTTMVALSILCLPQLVVSQVMTRMQLDWLGRPISDDKPYSGKTFFTVMAVVFSYNFLIGLIDYFLPSRTRYHQDFNHIIIDRNAMAAAIVSGLNLILTAYTILILVRTRSTVRRLYSIPESHWSCREGCEDVVFSSFLPFCTAAQLIRHTADHDEDGYWCLSATGVSPFESKFRVYMQKYWCCSPETSIPESGELTNWNQRKPTDQVLLV
mmetsp:Transcript_34855/g.68619  ORF Transcript_34855/g.68619 Transcript_34855/m.68619 type:complete len:422 (+) Transcript_34855:25-1290(+)